MPNTHIHIHTHTHTHTHMIILSLLNLILLPKSEFYLSLCCVFFFLQSGNTDDSFKKKFRVSVYFYTVALIEKTTTCRHWYNLYGRVVVWRCFVLFLIHRRWTSVYMSLFCNTFTIIAYLSKHAMNYVMVFFKRCQLKNKTRRKKLLQTWTEEQ